MSRCQIPLLVCALVLVACGRDSTGPDTRVQISVLAGDAQFGLTDSNLADPLQAVVVNAVTEQPEEGVTVTWTVRTGAGVVTPSGSTTDARGIATTQLRLGSQLGAYQVEATASGQVGAPASFSAEAVVRPQIASITPASAAAGQTVTINGANFNPRADYNAVRFAGVRGRILSATATRIDVVVPACVPSRTVDVDVLVGSVASAPVAFPATGLPGATLSLLPGEARFFADPSDLSCFRLPGGIAGARYLLVAQNAATSYTADLPFELASFTGTAPVASLLPGAPDGTATHAAAFELRLRQRERDWVADAAELRAATAHLAGQAIAPELGDRRTFLVLNSDDESVAVTAEVVQVSNRAILYQDVLAPAGGFSALDFANFGQVFDDPIYGTDAAVFGQPSDIDGNGRVIILFSPRVNALTDRGEDSFIAGYFYGCDLVERTRCRDSNRGEIFYSLVPDPQGKFGDARSTSLVLRSVLPVLAHELQHMINFAQRDHSLDALWLSEGLAHTAEEVVGQVFADRGDQLTARDFQRTNYTRGARFLSGMPDVSMIADDTPGSLELRGAAWLFLRYLRAHFGGDALLGQLTRSQLSSTQNVTSRTGESWARLLGDFGVALYTGALISGDALPRDPRHTFGSWNVRAAFLAQNGSYPLLLRSLPFTEAAVAGALRSSATSLFTLNAPGHTAYPPSNLVFAGARGGPFQDTGAPQLAVYRAR